MSTMEPVLSGVRLRVLEGAFHSELLRLERSLISLGRSTPETVASASYLTFPEPTVSRLHAVLTWESGARAFLLHHRSQTNPTVLNGTVISGPQLLKAGDKIMLGRLILLVEPEPLEAVPIAGTTAATTAPRMATASMTMTSAPQAMTSQAPLAQPELSLNAKIEGGDRIFSAPVKEKVISLTFANDRSTAVVTPPQAGGSQEVRLPGVTAAGIRFELDPAAGTCSVETGAENDAPSHRLSHGPGGNELRVPLRSGQSLPFVETDVIVHQGYRIWLGNPERPPESGATLSQKPSSDTERSKRATSLTLHFLNGPWKEATVSAPSSLPVNIRLGAGESGFRHPYPVTGIPQAEITAQGGVARLRAIEVADDQFLEVDGDLVFASESVSLVGGSRLLVGAAEYLWTDGSEALYETYRLVDGESVYPIRKASVRVGTAAHCEIMLNRRDLPPVLGRIGFETGAPVYHHLDISASIRVDGEEASNGLSVPLRPGSKLELKPGLVISLEQPEVVDR